jgi:transcriptional regulator with PAS, ATPase and Fis domain
VIAATNMDLASALEQKSFREDLYYRLNVFPIHIPALRDRREDILPLADYFAGKIAARMGRRFDGLHPDVQKMLYEYEWPGNVRELQNALERSLIVAKTNTVLAEDLPLQFERARPAASRPVTLAEIERAAILEALARNRGERRITAEQLGMSLRTLQYRLKEYGLVGKD